MNNNTLKSLPNIVGNNFLVIDLKIKTRKIKKGQRQFQVNMNSRELNIPNNFNKTKQISVNYPTFPMFDNFKSLNDMSIQETNYDGQLQRNQKQPNQKIIRNIFKNSNGFNKNLYEPHNFLTKKRVANLNSFNHKSSSGSVNNFQSTYIDGNSNQLELSLKVSPLNHQDLSSPNFPIGPRSCALQNYRFQLTSLEQEEIFNFNQIWFLGLNSKKTEAIKGSSPNNGYDDETGTYIKVPHDHIAFRYEILETLGKGSFGQVFRAIDHQTGMNVALKVIRNKKRFHQQSFVEVNILKHLNEKEKKLETSFHVIHLLNNFFFRNHPCLVFELLGENLYDVIKRNNFRGFSLPIIQKMAYSILSCLSVLRKENIIHCDLKPENILLMNNNSSEIKIIDFGSSCFCQEKIYTYIQSRFYRSPEVILGIPYTSQIDIWSFGCILPELLTGSALLLFYPVDYLTGRPIFPGETEMDQLLCIMEVFDLPPKSVLEESTRKRLFFDNNGEPRNLHNSKGRKRVPNSQTIQSTMKMNAESKFVDLIRNCLEWDAGVRIHPDNALKHSWFHDFHSNDDSFKENQISERNVPLKRPRHRIPNKDKVQLNYTHDIINHSKPNGYLPPIQSEFNKKTENPANDNLQFIENVMSNKTEFPSLYR